MATEIVLPDRLKELLALLDSPPAEQVLAESIHRQAMSAMVIEISHLQHKLAEQTSYVAALERMIDEDPLCPNILNRRAFERELKRAISLAKRSGRPGSVLFLDVNGLKTINDTHGHTTGDHAIGRVARMLVIACRTSDLIGRLGGDEFAVIMPETPPEGATIRGQRVAEILGSIPLQVGDGTISFTAAYGAAGFNGSESVKDVLHAADTAMYQHKALLKSIRTAD